MTEITAGNFPDKETVCALGLFDGVHRGHRLVINTAADIAEEKGLSSAVFSFKTDTVTSKGHDGRVEMILSDRSKHEHFSELGVDYLYSPDFAEMKNMSGEEFIKKVLIDQLKCKAIVCGSDFRFGKGAAEDRDSLKFFGRKYGIDIHVCEKLKYKGEEVSSTAIRKYIRSGMIEKANELLGYTFGLNLVVEHGRQIGRTWNFPTINQIIPQGQILPKFGVYASRVKTENEIRFGVTNIGVKPTLKMHDAPLAETYILDFSADLYGKELKIYLDKFIRPEIGFDSIDELRAQIAADTRTVRDFYGISYG